MKPINLIVTCPKSNEVKTASLLFFILRNDLEDENADCVISDFPGVIYGRTGLNPNEVIRFIRNKLKKNPFYLGKFSRATPIHMLTALKKTDIISKALNLATLIDKNETYKIEIKNRGKKVDSTQLIDDIASNIKREVNLDNPHKIIRIEILSDSAGVSILDDSTILVRPAME